MSFPQSCTSLRSPRLTSLCWGLLLGACQPTTSPTAEANSTSNVPETPVGMAQPLSASRSNVAATLPGSAMPAATNNNIAATSTSTPAVVHQAEDGDSADIAKVLQETSKVASSLSNKKHVAANCTGIDIDDCVAEASKPLPPPPPLSSMPLPETGGHESRAASDPHGRRPVDDLTPNVFVASRTAAERAADSGPAGKIAYGVSATVGLVDDPFDGARKKSMAEAAFAVHRAALVGDLRNVQRATNGQRGEAIDWTDAYGKALGRTLLHAAVMGGQTHVVAYLLERGANPNFYARGSRNTRPALVAPTLHLLARAKWGDREQERFQHILKLLLDAGADLHALARDERTTALDAAFEQKLVGNAAALLRAGALPAQTFSLRALADGSAAPEAPYTHMLGVMPLLQHIAFHEAVRTGLVPMPPAGIQTIDVEGLERRLHQLPSLAASLPEPQGPALGRVLGLSLWLSRYTSGPYLRFFDALVKSLPPDGEIMKEWFRWALVNIDKGEVPDKKARWAVLSHLVRYAENLEEPARADLTDILKDARKALSESPGTLRVDLFPEAGQSLLSALPFVIGLSDPVSVQVDVDEPVWMLKERIRVAYPAYRNRDFSLWANGQEFVPEDATVRVFGLQNGQTMSSLGRDILPPTAK